MQGQLFLNSVLNYNNKLPRKENLKMKNFHILTFGCQMNVRDSNWLQASLLENGYNISDLDEAEIIIINSCSVREKPERKIENLIRQIAGKTHNNPDIIICVTGCVAQQCGQKLFEISSQVRLVLGPDAFNKIPVLLEELVFNPDMKIINTDFETIFPERKILPEVWPFGSAYINIMQGCDNFCSYCIVPYTRGRQKSRSGSVIIDECKRALDSGASEITLLGQNVNAWGKDNSKGNFPDLLEEIASLAGLKRLRFVTPHPADFDEKTITSFKYLENLCPRLHLPLQSGSDRILKSMRRRYTRSDYMKLIESLYKNRPDLAISTDLITGFPGETDEDFEETLDMMRNCNFISSFSFCYSDRPGTKASYMKEKIPAEVKRERLISLQSLQDKLTAQHLKKRIDSFANVLVEAPSSKSEDKSPQWQGKDEYGIVVNIDSEKVEPGQYVKVKIKSAGKHSLKGIISN